MNEQKYQIISDGSCDLAPGLAEKLQVTVVPFYVSFDSENYYKEMEEIPVRDFYDKMVDCNVAGMWPSTAGKKVYPKSSMPTVEDYINVFEPCVKNGIPVICICITTKFSGSMNSASNAAGILKDKYPDARITVIDSTVNTVLQGLYVIEAARMQKDGLSYDEAVSRLEEIKSTGRIIFTIGSMDYLQKGGRIGKVVGVLSSTFKIMPLIHLHDGEIFPSGIIRNRRRGLAKLIEQVREHFQSVGESPDQYSLAVGCGYDYEEAAAFRDELLQSLQEYSGVKEVPIYQIGATIGVHTGPYPLGVGLIRKYDAD